MVAHQDVVTSVFGASTGLGGLTLVFLGMLIQVRRGISAAAPIPVKRKAEQAAWRAFAAFSWSIASAALALAWLTVTDCDGLYWTSVVVFSADLVAIVAFAASATARLLN